MTSLTRLAERLAVIDKAQQNITSALEPGGRAAEGARQQADPRRLRPGADGGDHPGRAAARAATSSRRTLTNGNRPDCLITLPERRADAGRRRQVPARGAGTRSAPPRRRRRRRRPRPRSAATRMQARPGHRRRATSIAGETHDTAFMFVPSESIFADIHERFEDVVQHAHRARVVIVSPSLLMLSIQVVMSLLRDVRMREQAHVIQQEVVKLLEDVAPARRPRAQAPDPLRARPTRTSRTSSISTRKITKRGSDIDRESRSRPRAADAAPRRPARGRQRRAAGTAAPRGYEGLVAPAALEELDLLRRRFAAEHRVAVREAAELPDDVAVLGGEVE